MERRLPDGTFRWEFFLEFTKKLGDGYDFCWNLSLNKGKIFFLQKIDKKITFTSRLAR